MRSVKTSLRQAFTIVELLIVIVAIAVLAAITVVSCNGIQDRANEAVARNDLANVKKVLANYHAEHGMYPQWIVTNGLYMNENSGNANSLTASGATCANYGFLDNDGRLCFPVSNGAFISHRSVASRAGYEILAGKGDKAWTTTNSSSISNASCVNAGSGTGIGGRTYASYDCNNNTLGYS